MRLAALFVFAFLLVCGMFGIADVIVAYAMRDFALSPFYAAMFQMAGIVLIVASTVAIVWIVGKDS